MNRKTILMTAVLGVAGLAATGFAALPTATPLERSLQGMQGDIQRGAYVARLSACITCHTDVQNGGPVLAGGAPIKTMYGTFYPPNITPDEEHGIGAWTLQDFARALTRGQGPDGQHYLPAFPYPFYERMTDRDIADLWAAVNSVPPVPEPTPAHDMVVPISTSLAAQAWKRVFFQPPTTQRDAGDGDTIRRGEYLATGPAHCGACHTPRNLLGARLKSQRYVGGEASDGEPAPPITPQALKKNGWTKENLAYALRSGLMPDGDSFSGSMAKVVNGSTRFWTDADLDAVAAYMFEEEQE